MTPRVLAGMLFVLLFSLRAEAGDACSQWLIKTGAKPGAADCEMKCATADVDVGTFHCPAECGRFCKIASKPESQDPSTGKEGSGADIEVKEGVDIDRLTDKIRLTFNVIVEAFKGNSAPTLVITSGNDSRHGKGSLHYSNNAIDLRANNVSDEVQNKIAHEIQENLGGDYDVVSEHSNGHPERDHIHIEYDPPAP